MDHNHLGVRLTTGVHPGQGAGRRGKALCVDDTSVCPQAIFNCLCCQEHPFVSAGVLFADVRCDGVFSAASGHGGPSSVAGQLPSLAILLAQSTP